MTHTEILLQNTREKLERERSRLAELQVDVTRAEYLVRMNILEDIQRSQRRIQELTKEIRTLENELRANRQMPLL